MHTPQFAASLTIIALAGAIGATPALAAAQQPAPSGTVFMIQGANGPATVQEKKKDQTPLTLDLLRPVASIAAKMDSIQKAKAPKLASGVRATGATRRKVTIAGAGTDTKAQSDGQASASAGPTPGATVQIQGPDGTSQQVMVTGAGEGQTVTAGAVAGATKAKSFSLGDPVAMQAKMIQDTPEMLELVTQAGLTPEEYASRYMRLRMAWSMMEMSRSLDAQGMGGIQQLMGGFASADDVEFVRSNEADLKQMGFQPPQKPKMQHAVRQNGDGPVVMSAGSDDGSVTIEAVQIEVIPDDE